MGKCSASITFSIIVLLTFNNIAWTEKSQAEHVLQLGLVQTIKLSLAASEELKIKDSEIAKSQGVYRQVRSEALPQISAETTWLHNMEHPLQKASLYPDYIWDNELSGSQVIWSFGKVMYAINSAKRAVEAAKFNKESGRQEIIYVAKLSYYSSLLAKDVLAISEKSYQNALENKKLLKERSYGGRSSKYEIIRMDAEVAARIPTVNEAKAEFDASLETLKRLINAESNCNIVLMGDFQEEYEELNYDTLVAMMYEREPSLKSLGKSIESAEADIKSKYASFFPTVSAFASWVYTGSSDENSFVKNDELYNYSFAGIKVSIPIWEGGLKEAQLSQSKAVKEIAVLRSKQAEKDLLLELKKAFLKYEQYKANLKANIEAVNLAEEAFKQTQEMFSSGQVTLTDLNNAELLLTNQRLNKEMTLYNINITLAKIEKLVAGEYKDSGGNEEF